MTVFLTSLLGAAAATLFVYALWMLLVQARRDDDPSYRDEPPRRFKVLWLLVLAVANLSNLLLREPLALKIDARLQKGGVNYALTPQQFEPNLAARRKLQHRPCPGRIRALQT